MNGETKTKIDIFSGFLGAGKTTLIRKLVAECFRGGDTVIIENEFGEIGIDGGFLQDAGIRVTEMNSGCICCSLVGDFSKALKKVTEEYAPGRIIIEPSGVGKLSDVVRAVEAAGLEGAEINSATAVCDAGKAPVYSKNFGEFYNDQISHATAVVLTHTDKVSEEKLAAAVETVRKLNPRCAMITTPIDSLTGEQILAVIENRDTLDARLRELEEEACPVCHGHRHDHDGECHGHHHEDGECCGHHHEDGECCGHHHDHDGEEHEHCHHDHEEHEGHDHEHGHCCHHHHHDGHDADEVFPSWGVETARVITRAAVEHALDELESGKYGAILRSKGIVNGGADGWLEFDYVPGEREIRTRRADVGGKLVVIGSKLDEAGIAKLFNV